MKTIRDLQDDAYASELAHRIGFWLVVVAAVGFSIWLALA